jgi:hypothetical protein
MPLLPVLDSQVRTERSRVTMWSVKILSLGSQKVLFFSMGRLRVSGQYRRGRDL